MDVNDSVGYDAFLIDEARTSSNSSLIVIDFF